METEAPTIANCDGIKVPEAQDSSVREMKVRFSAGLHMFAIDIASVGL
jgi:hypothetical protein